MAEDYQERQVAIKIKIKEINEGKYVTQEGWKPNYLLTNHNQKVSRVNLMGIVLNKEVNQNTLNLLLDDSSGNITIRFFEKMKNLDTINIGDTILLVGKIRIFNEEKYITPEIIKKVDKNWLKLRRLELNQNQATTQIVEEEKPVEEEPEDVNKKIIEIIKELDKGDGVLIEEVKEKTNLSDVDDIIEKMLKEGEIFNNLPGKIKVL